MYFEITCIVFDKSDNGGNSSIVFFSLALNYNLKHIGNRYKFTNKMRTQRQGSPTLWRANLEPLSTAKGRALGKIVGGQL